MTTIQLEPSALEAVANAIREESESRYGYGCSAEDLARAAITAYLAAIEPQVRAAVDTLINSAQKSMWDDHPDDHERYGAYLRIDKAALFALLGMTETTSETTENKGY